MAIVFCPLEGWHKKYTGPAKCIADDSRVRAWGSPSHDSFFCRDEDAAAFVEMYGPQQVKIDASQKDAADFYESGL